MINDFATAKAKLRQADAIAQLAGFEKTEQRKALDAALLAGRATSQQITALLILEARLLGAQNILNTLPAADPRRATIQANYEINLAHLYEMADAMGGAVRLTLKI